MRGGSNRINDGAARNRHFPQIKVRFGSNRPVFDMDAADGIIQWSESQTPPLLRSVASHFSPTRVMPVHEAGGPVSNQSVFQAKH